MKHSVSSSYAVQGVTKPCTSVRRPYMLRGKSPVQSSFFEFNQFSAPSPSRIRKNKEEKEKGRKRNLDGRQTGWGNWWPANEDAHRVSLRPR